TLPEGPRAGRLDQREPLIGEQRLADRAAASDDEAEDTLGLSAGGHAVEDLLGRDGDQRGQARWLPHDRVTANQGDRPPPAWDRDREVERRDDADNPERVPLLEQAMVPPLRGDLFAEELPRLPDREVAGVDDFLPLAQRLAQDL